MTTRLGLVLASILALASAACGQDYSVVLMPTLGGRASHAVFITENGLITGDSSTATGSSHAFFWSRAGGIVDIQAPGALSSTGISVNSAGQVTGYVNLCACQNSAFVWTKSGGMQSLNIPGEIFSYGNGINKTGTIVGTYSSDPVNFTSKGYLWTAVGGEQDMDSLGCVGCLPNAINDRGQVVGTIPQPDGSSRAFIWTKTYGIKDLGTLGGPNSTPLAINPVGTVVGFSDTADGALRAFVWTRATGMQDLGTLAGDTHSWALAIDGNGRVVGSSWHPGVNQGRPFSWTPSGGMQELGPFDQKNIQSADGVNKAGEILLSRYGGGGYTSFLLTPIMHTALNVSPNPAHVGETVTLTATVNSAVHPPPPNGEVVHFFYGGNTLLGTATLHAGVATLTTTFTTSRLLTAVYVGDSNYASSKSLAVKEVIVK